jgi:hypothetical protein
MQENMQAVKFRQLWAGIAPALRAEPALKPNEPIQRREAAHPIGPHGTLSQFLFYYKKPRHVIPGPCSSHHIPWDAIPMRMQMQT